jgi:hypothetical protein
MRKCATGCASAHARPPEVSSREFKTPDRNFRRAASAVCTQILQLAASTTRRTGVFSPDSDGRSLCSSAPAMTDDEIAVNCGRCGCVLIVCFDDLLTARTVECASCAGTPRPRAAPVLLLVGRPAPADAKLQPRR